MTDYVLKRSSDILCTAWGGLNALRPSSGKRAWRLDSIATPPGRGAADYIKVNDEITVIQIGDRFDLVLSRKGVPDRVHQGVQLGGTDAHPALWAKASASGLDVFLYQLKTQGGRQIHVEVFYIKSQYDAELPSAPGQVEIV